MALLWFDGFENYNDDTDISAVKSPVQLTPNSMAHGAVGRRGSRGLSTSNYTDYVYVQLASSIVSGLFGIAMKRASGTPTYNATYPTFYFHDSVGGSDQVRLHIVGSEIAAYRGDGTLLGTSSGAGLTDSVWQYIEAKVLIDNSSGYVVVRVGGSVVLNLTSQDTQNTANASFNRILFRPAHPVLNAWFDDFYICDLTGSKNNDFLGDVRVDVIRPNAIGTHSDFTPSAGNNYENVDESAGPDDDTTYNDGSTPGDKDSYNLESLSSLGTTIHGIKSQITIKKTDAGSKRAKVLTKSGSTEDLSDSISLSDSYTTETKILEDNPDDSAAWEEADVNAMEVGIQIVTTTTTSTTSTTTTTV